MPEPKRTYEMDAFFLEALKLIERDQAEEKKDQGESPRLEKKDVQTSKDVVMRLIASLLKA